MNTEQLTLQKAGEMPFWRKLCLLGYIPDATLFAPPHSREQIRLDSKTYDEDQELTGKSSLVQEDYTSIYKVLRELQPRTEHGRSGKELAITLGQVINSSGPVYTVALGIWWYLTGF